MNPSQPQFIIINDTLRLRKYDGNYHSFLTAYQDPFVYQNSEGIFDESHIPTLDYVKGMCEYLTANGELYFIEIIADGEYISIGDVTVKCENPPIAIWYDKYRNKGIGKLVMMTVIGRLRELGAQKITDSTVYKWNIASQKLHESLGFRKTKESETEYFYELNLSGI